MGQALSAVSARDAHCFFEHAVYRPVGQLQRSSETCRIGTLFGWNMWAKIA
jgi:hypothetical protein